MRMAGEDEGNSKSGKSYGNGGEEGDCKEEGDGEQ